MVEIIKLSLMQLTICWYNNASFGQNVCFLIISAAYINHIPVLRWSILPLNFYKAIFKQFADICIIRI